MAAMYIDGVNVQATVPQALPALFAQCRFCIVSSHALTEYTAQKLVSAIQDNGGRAVLDFSPQGKLPLEDVTHLISPTIDFPDYDSACGALIPVVKPEWVDASISRNKLANPRQYNPDPRLFLSDVVVCCADLPEGDKDAIIGGVLAMGGLYSQKVASMVTHIVALTMDSEKCALVESKRLNIKIVLPHWFDDCLKLGKRIDERPYMLPDPEILHLAPDEPLRPVECKGIIGASTPEPRNLPTPGTSPSANRRGLQVFTHKKVMLSSDLGIGSHLRGTIEDVIFRGGGMVTASVHKADMFICRYRDGDDYKTASRSGKDVGNLSWLYYLMTHDAWTSPLRRLLHYPVARHSLCGFKNLKISLSNYSGEARIYLENLIVATGAECTKTLKQDNTHLISAHVVSEKCLAAKDWGIHTVNHLWLEESYAKWKMQSVSNPRFTHFPLRTNLGEVVGQTKIDRHAVEQVFFPEEEETDTDGEIPAPKAMQQKDRNTLVGQVPNSSAIQSPRKMTEYAKPSRAQFSDGPTPKAPKDNRRLSDKIRTPAASRFIGEGKENKTPSTTSSRKSKEIAAARLHDIAPDIALYEKEKNRVGGVVYGGKKKNDIEKSGHNRKRSMDDDTGTDVTEGKETKRAKTSRLPPTMHLLLSGYKRWQGEMKREDEEKRHLRDLGVMVIQDPSRCTHLAAPSVVRTHKFISALAYAPIVLHTDFVTDCLSKDEFLSPNDYILRDSASESRFGFTMTDSHAKAKANKNRLLHGHTIYCVEGIHGGFDVFKSIVEANGGRCALYRGRAGTMIPSRRSDSDAGHTGDESESETVHLISGIKREDVRLWPRFRQMAEGSRMSPKIVKADWLLDIAMSQELRSEDRYELREEDVTVGE